MPLMWEFHQFFKHQREQMDTSSPVDQLIKMLKELDAHFDEHPDELIKYQPSDCYFMYDHVKQQHSAAELEEIEDPHAKAIAKLYYGIVRLADEELITQKGNPDFGKHAILSSHGYRVRCGESDGFGWLTGIIVGKHFQITYG
mgnify:CR=1 FL=1